MLQALQATMHHSNAMQTACFGAAPVEIVSISNQRATWVVLSRYGPIAKVGTPTCLLRQQICIELVASLPQRQLATQNPDVKAEIRVNKPEVGEAHFARFMRKILHFFAGLLRVFCGFFARCTFVAGFVARFSGFFALCLACPRREVNYPRTS